MSREPRLLGKWVRSHTSDARLARQWGRVRERLPGRPRSARLAPRLAALVAFLLVVLVVSFRRLEPGAPSALEGALLETEAGEQQTLSLPEGSTIALEGATRLRLTHVAAKDVRLDLERGVVRFHVAHVDGRTFVVTARGVAVRVVGTRFRVALREELGVESVFVSVDEGRVAVDRGAVGTAMVSAGETWSAIVSTPPSPPAPVVSAPPSGSASAPVHVVVKPRGPKRKLPGRFHELFAEGDYTAAYGQIEADDFHAWVDDLGAADLLELAVAARLSGHPRRAAIALERIRTAFRTNPRAGIAALDLARLRLDELNDAAGALVALDDAIALAPNADLKEDAEARRVQALEKLGDVARCIVARDDYLLRHPDGVHTTTVARRCTSP